MASNGELMKNDEKMKSINMTAKKNQKKSA